MEKEIRIFENFALASNILPFYAYTHQCYLLMARLCKGSRKKLDEYYFEFVAIMRPYWIYIWPEDNLKRYMVPNDLFGLCINLEKYNQVMTFIEFIKNIKEKKGWYFNKYYMHQQIFTYGITVDRTLIQYLHPYLDDLKSIEVYWDEYKYQSRLHPDKLFLYDTNIKFLLVLIFFL